MVGITRESVCSRYPIVTSRIFAHCFDVFFSAVAYTSAD